MAGLLGIMAWYLYLGRIGTYEDKLPLPHEDTKCVHTTCMKWLTHWAPGIPSFIPSPSVPFFYLAKVPKFPHFSHFANLPVRTMFLTPKSPNLNSLLISVPHLIHVLQSHCPKFCLISDSKIWITHPLFHTTYEVHGLWFCILILVHLWPPPHHPSLQGFFMYPTQIRNFCNTTNTSILLSWCPSADTSQLFTQVLNLWLTSPVCVDITGKADNLLCGLPFCLRFSRSDN